MENNACFSEHFVPLSDGLRMYCREYGSGHVDAPAVLCLPGLTRNCRDFESLAQWLAATHRVLTPDLRGRGRSDRDPNWHNYQPLNYVADIGQLLRALDASRVVIIGTSLGGLVAMIMATLQPAALAGVVLNDIGPEIDPVGLARIGRHVGQQPPVDDWRQAAAQARQVNAVALPDLTDEQWMAFARRIYRDDGSGRPVLDMDPMIGAAMRETAGHSPDLWILYRSLAGIPALAIRGELSDLLSEATLLRMQELKPDLRTLVVPARGHAPTLDEPESRAAIRSLLDSIQ
jgi:pimeloyl-ACP methyl ester carboxylesterase